MISAIANTIIMEHHVHIILMNCMYKMVTLECATILAMLFDAPTTYDCRVILLNVPSLVNQLPSTQEKWL